MPLPSYAGIAGTWTMNSGPEVPPAESSLLLEATQESLFDPDYRALVDPTDYNDGGKYRSIVKLQMRFERQEADDKAYAMGTGWLIAPDILVTAGHNVFDWSGYGIGLGRAVHIKAYIGYHGKGNIDSPAVQLRLAKNVVTTGEWLTSRENRHRDVAIIQLDRPFTGNLRLFSYKSTPKQADEMIGVVGYPADKVFVNADETEEKGAMMYEQFGGIAYSTDKNKGNPLGMLKYRISTFGGQSGAPVLRKGSKLIAIGTHVYGGGDKNSASTIGGDGNNYETLLKVLTQQLPAIGDYNGIKLVKQDSDGLSPIGVKPITASNGQDYENHEAEGFFDILKQVGRVVGGTIPIASPLLGIIGGPIAAVAGSVLNNLAAESSFDVSSDLSTTGRAAGATERAILAEAALQAVLKLPSDSLTAQKVLGDMKNTYTTHAPNLKDIAPKIAPILVQSAIRIKGDQNYIGKLSGGQRTLPARPLTGVAHAEASFGSNDFLACMLAPTKPVDGEAEMFGHLGPLIDIGTKFATPLLGQAAQKGLGMLGGLLKESAFTSESNFADGDLKATELISKRALLGEAALQAFSKLNKAELEELKIVDTQEDSYEEGFIDFIKSSVQKIGGIVRQVAPRVIETVMPIAIGAMKKTSQSGPSVAGHLNVPPGPAPVLRKKASSSILDDLNNGNLKTRISA